MGVRKKIVIIGGGISGLSAALEITGFSPAAGAPEVEILEASDSAGGTISTFKKDGFTLELGPDSFFADAQTLEFCSKIGISPRLMGTSERDRKVFIMREGRAVPLPDGFFMMAPRKILPFLSSPLFSFSCKLRTLAEFFIKPRPHCCGEESVASFVRRRFGSEILQKAAAPLIGGIYCASPETLGAESVLPEFVKMERERGGVLRSLIRERGEKTGGGARFGKFLSPESGMSEMVEAALRKLPPGCLQTRRTVSKLLKKEVGWEIVSQDGRRVYADAVVVAVRCSVAASMLEGTGGALPGLLASVAHSSCAVAVLVYENAAISGIPKGFGTLFPDSRKGEVFACSFLNRKFPEKAPEGFSVIRFFMGGDEVCALDDSGIVLRAQKFARKTFGAVKNPRIGLAGKYAGGMPVCGVGHQNLVSRIMDAADEAGGIFFAGAGYGGVGIPDCIRSGLRAGAKAASCIS